MHAQPSAHGYKPCVIDLEGDRQGYACASGLAVVGTVLEQFDSGGHVIAIDDLPCHSVW